MDYNTIAYKVENGVITNACVVNASDDLEEGFIKRSYPLGIGFVESFEDFYPPATTQEDVDNARARLKDKCSSDLEIYTNKLDDLKANYPDTTPDGTPLEYSNDIIEQKDQVQRYVNYLEELNQQIENLRNPIQYQYKKFEEV